MTHHVLSRVGPFASVGSRQASYTSHMSRMSYNSHGDLLNGKPPAMAGSSSKDYRSGGRLAQQYNNATAAHIPAPLPPAHCSVMGSRPTLVPDLVVEYSRHHHHHHHHQPSGHHHHHDYVMTIKHIPLPFTPSPLPVRFRPFFVLLFTRPFYDSYAQDHNATDNPFIEPVHKNAVGDMKGKREKERAGAQLCSFKTSCIRLLHNTSLFTGNGLPT